MKRTTIGGQAVMEGVMMKNEDQYAVAVRKPNHEIEVKKDSYQSVTKRYPILNLPILWSLLNSKDHNFGQFFLNEYAYFFP